MYIQQSENGLINNINEAGYVGEIYTNLLLMCINKINNWMWGEQECN